MDRICSIYIKLYCTGMVINEYIFMETYSDKLTNITNYLWDFVISKPAFYINED